MSTHVNSVSDLSQRAIMDMRRTLVHVRSSVRRRKHAASQAKEYLEHRPSPSSHTSVDRLLCDDLDEVVTGIVLPSVQAALSDARASLSQFYVSALLSSPVERKQLESNTRRRITGRLLQTGMNPLYAQSITFALMLEEKEKWTSLT